MPSAASLRFTERWRALVERVNQVLGHYPSRFAFGVFASLVTVFTVLFSLPISSSDGSITPLHNAFFIAVSVICVTGLATVDMATHWSPFGNALVFIGVNIGAIGVLTMASLLGFIIAGRLGLRAKLLAASDSNVARARSGPVSESQAIRLGDMRGILLTVGISMVVIEGGLAIGLLPSMLSQGYAVGPSLWYSVYYAAMSFTNSGFSPNPGGISVFATDYWFQFLLMVGVFLGSIGFPVLYTLVRAWRRPRRWPLHVKLTLSTTVLLFVLGAIGFVAFELTNPKTFGSMDAVETGFQALFMSAMTRSGGFSMVNPNDLSGSGMLLSSMLMFIGGGSASTAGGIKVTTLAVLFLAAVAEARGRNASEAFGRRIPIDILRLAVSVTIWGTTLVAAACLAIMAVSHASLDRVLFEVISAFATCGLSNGLTNELDPAGVVILALTMFFGRLGTVTLAAALAASTTSQLYKLPEERPMVG